MSSKIKIKFGQIEIEYEGSEEFLKTDLLEIISSISNLNQPIEETNSSNDSPINSLHANTTVSTSTIVSKIGEGTGTNLALAASLKLTVVDQKQSFTRDEILNEMKAATSFYKTTYRSNLSKSIKSLVTSGKLNELGQNKYSISAQGLNEGKPYL